LTRVAGAAAVVYLATLTTVLTQSRVGREVAIPEHLQSGQWFPAPLRDLLAHGQRLFSAVWTAEEGGGRPRTKGTGAPLSDPSSPLEFPRSFKRLSGPPANSCAAVHAARGALRQVVAPPATTCRSASPAAAATSSPTSSCWRSASTSSPST